MATLTVSTEIEGEIQDVIGNGLDDYNVGKAGPYNTEDLWIVARDEAGAVEAGLKAKSEYSWLFVDWLWVDPGRRGTGLGAELLGKAEEIARERGCRGVYSKPLPSRRPASTSGLVIRKSGGSRISRRVMPWSG